MEDPKENRSPPLETGEMSKASDTSAPSPTKTEAESQPSTSAQPEEKEDEPEIDEEKEEPPAVQEQPIFKPITTDKGKSKVYGKTIGGWI